jgi:hypothetical protein
MVCATLSFSKTEDLSLIRRHPWLVNEQLESVKLLTRNLDIVKSIIFPHNVKPCTPRISVHELLESPHSWLYHRSGHLCCTMPGLEGGEASNTAYRGSISLSPLFRDGDDANSVLKCPRILLITTKKYATGTKCLLRALVMCKYGMAGGVSGSSIQICTTRKNS